MNYTDGCQSGVLDIFARAEKLTVLELGMGEEDVIGSLVHPCRSAR